MITDFLIINCIGKDDKLGLRINKDFFIYDFSSKNINGDKLVSQILKLLNSKKVQLNDRFSVILNQGPGSFSRTRISLAVAKGLKIAKKVRLYGYKNEDLREFDQKNIEKLLANNLLEKNLIKPIYLS